MSPRYWNQEGGETKIQSLVSVHNVGELNCKSLYSVYIDRVSFVGLRRSTCQPLRVCFNKGRIMPAPGFTLPLFISHSTLIQETNPTLTHILSALKSSDTYRYILQCGLPNWAGIKNGPISCLYVQ